MMFMLHAFEHPDYRVLDLGPDSLAVSGDAALAVRLAVRRHRAG